MYHWYSQKGREWPSRSKPFAGELEEDLKNAIDATLLPDQPAYDTVNAFLIDAYERMWQQ